MKKKLIFAISALLTLGLGSCITERPGGEEMTNLVIKVSNADRPNTRAIGDPATSVKADITLIDSQSLIFVADATGAIIKVVDLVANEATSADGQDAGAVPLGSKVYVVANIPISPSDEYTRIKALTTLADVKDAVSTIAHQASINFNTPAMANVDTGSDGKGDEVAVTATTGTQKIDVSIKPLVARLEVVALQAIKGSSTNTVTGFKVAGIYVDNYYDSYSYSGGIPSTATLVSKEAALKAAGTTAATLDGIYTGWDSFMKEENGATGWTATGALLERPAANKVWSFNVAASGAVPRIIFKVVDITYTDAAGSSQTLAGPRYITVEGYEDNTNGAVSAFSRGEVYRIGAVTTGNSNLQFDYGHLNENPYEESVGLTVKVDVIPWVVKDYTPVLRP